MLDLPGAYSLEPTSLDEAIARDVVLGRHASEPPPDLLVCVVDATNLRLNLRLVLELKRLGRPMIVALNMSDVARAPRLSSSIARCWRASSACRSSKPSPCSAGGERALVEAIDRLRLAGAHRPCRAARHRPLPTCEATQREVRRILSAIGYRVPARLAFLAKLDASCCIRWRARCCSRRCCS